MMSALGRPRSRLSRHAHACSDGVCQLAHLGEQEFCRVDFARSRIAVGFLEFRLQPSSLGADLDKRDVVVIGLGEHVGALSLAPGELIPGRLQKASAPLDERDKQSLPVALECAGECAGPRRG